MFFLINSRKHMKWEKWQKKKRQHLQDNLKRWSFWATANANEVSRQMKFDRTIYESQWTRGRAPVMISMLIFEFLQAFPLIPSKQLWNVSSKKYGKQQRTFPVCFSKQKTKTSFSVFSYFKNFKNIFINKSLLYWLFIIGSPSFFMWSSMSLNLHFFFVLFLSAANFFQQALIQLYNIYMYSNIT